MKQSVAAIEVTNTGQKEVHLYRHTKIAKGSQLALDIPWILANPPRQRFIWSRLEETQKTSVG